MQSSMKTSLRQTILATVAVFGLGTFAAVAATTPPATGMPATGMPAPTTGQAMPAVPGPAAAARHQTMSERVDARIAELHAQLNITPAEKPQWLHFTAVMRANARDMDRTMRQRLAKLPSLNAEQNMQSYVHVAAVHAQNMRKLLPAFEHLYHVMSPSQKQTADQVFRNDAYRAKPMHKG